MVEVSEDGGTMITGDSISLYRVITLKAGLKLEIQGMRMTRGRTCYSMIKEEFGFKGNKEKVLAQIEELLGDYSSSREDKRI
jgi:hypothetical protein